VTGIDILLVNGFIGKKDILFVVEVRENRCNPQVIAIIFIYRVLWPLKTYFHIFV
jgi:hypothetical protein